MRTFSILSCFFWLCIASISINAQIKGTVENDPEAEKILGQIKTKFNKLAAYTLAYKMSTTDVNGKKTSQEGTYTGSGQKFSIQTTELILINNGKTQWNIKPKEKEIQIQEVLAAKLKAETPIAVIQNYKTLFKYRVKQRDPNGTIVLELVPKNKNGAIFKIDLSINVAKNQITMAKFYDKGGSRTEYLITSIAENPKLTDGTFNPVLSSSYPGYEVLDMR